MDSQCQKNNYVKWKLYLLTEQIYSHTEPQVIATYFANKFCLFFLIQ